jgi:lysophospholipase L1-like esterase
MPRERRSKYANDAVDNAGLASQLAQSAKKTEVRLKVDKLVMEDMSDTVISAISGGTTVNVLSIPQDESVTPNKTSFLSAIYNLFDKTKVTQGIANASNGGVIADVSYYITDFIPITPGKTYPTNLTHYDTAFYDSSKIFVSGQGGMGLITAPTGASYLKTTLPKTDVDSFVLSENVLPPSYLPYGTNMQITDPKFKGLINDAIDGINGNQTTFFKEDVRNLFNKRKAIDNALINGGNGELLVGYPEYIASDFIPVIEGKHYTSTPHYDFAYYDSNKVFVSGGSMNTNTFTIPSGVSYIRLTFNPANKETAQFTCNEITQLSFKTSDFFDDITNEITKNQSDLKIISSKWYGKKWSAIGDSITEYNFRTKRNYHDYISDRLLCKVNNYGISGTGYITSYGESPAIKDRLDVVDTTSDLVTVFAGTNDWDFGGKPLGTFGDTDQTATIYGAIHYVIDGLITRFPSKTIAVFTPLPRSNNWGSNAATNAQGYTLEQLSEAIIKVCKHYSVPCLDLYHNSNLPVFNVDGNNHYFTAPNQPSPDGLHPNDEGHKVLADKILSFLNTL